VATVVAAAAGLGRGLAGVVASPLPGPSGNVEFFVHLRADAAISHSPDDTSVVERIAKAVAEGPL